MKRTRKIVSVILAVAMLFSCFMVSGISASADTPVWDGSTITKPAGAGTADNPYLISNGEELAWMVMSYGGNNYFSFVDDIYLNDVDKINWETGEAEEGYTINPWYNRTQAWQIFNGKVNGNGHVIYGLYTNDQTQFAEGSGGFGLFPVCGNVTINGLGIDKSYLEGYTMYSLGAFAGYGQGSLKGSMENCYVGADVTIKGKDAGAFVGGGDIASMFTIKNCYSLASLSYTRRGGLVGDSWTSEYTFENVYCLDSTLTNSVAKATNCYSTISGTGLTQVAKENMQGTVFDGNSLVLGDAFMATETYPILKVFADKVPAFSGLAERPAGGDGSSMEKAYEISNVGQLAFFVAQGWGNAKLVNDIYINDIEKIDWATGEILDENYTPVTWFYGTDNAAAYYKGFSGSKAFSGKFDGNGFTIHGLWYPNDFGKTTAGLFPGGSSATIKNLQLSNSYVVGGRFIGAVTSTFSGTMENVVVDETVTVKQKRNITTDSYSVGGLIGYSNGTTLRNCASMARLIGDSHKYGLIGTSWGTKIDAANCFSYGQQPFTTSIGSKEFNTAAEAETYYKNLYKVSGVYTDLNKQGNKVSYKCDTDGDGTKDSVSYEVFTFTNLTSSQMVGKSALDNMPLLDSNIFYATAGLPRTKWWATANGDADLDGIQAMAGDYAAIRKAIIGAGDTGCTDFDRNGKTDVFDLLKVWNLSPTYNSGEFVYTLEKFANLAEYKIVYKNGDAEAKRAAEALAQAYKEQGITLSVLPDTAAISAKEILVGDTNRGLHVDGLPDGKYEISVIADTIQISASAGTPAALTTAVKTYKELSPKGFVAVTEGWHEYEGGSVTLATNMTNWIYKDKRERTYTYVWGDEFYGDTLNPNKWVCTTGSSKMSGYSDLTILSGKEAVNVNGGSLNLIAGQRADGSFFAPASVHTQGTMEYRYGYIEMRAKIPYRVGVWPSFWMQSAATLGGRQNYDYMVEVDMLEVFGHTSDLYCNVHKWYSSAKQEQYGVRNIAAAEDGGISGFLSQLFGRPVGEEKRTVENPENWHTYGFAWDANYMCMYVDQKLFRVYDITSATTIFGSDNVKKTDSDMSGFHDPLYIIFNNHVFTPGANFKPGQINGYESNLPATYEIDYVRLYQGTETNSKLWTK